MHTVNNAPKVRRCVFALWSSPMVQVWNPSGIITFAHVVALPSRRPLAIPHISVRCTSHAVILSPMQYSNFINGISRLEIREIHAISALAQIRFERLKQAGFRGVIFDKDNTLTIPYAPDLHPSVQVLLSLRPTGVRPQMSRRSPSPVQLRPSEGVPLLFM
jgi:hypothetical protein